MEILYKEFSPTNQNGKNTDLKIVYLPGWSIAPASLPVANLCTSLANEFGVSVYAIQTQDHKIDALESFTPKIKKILLVAHSQGSIKMIELTNFLQEKSDISIKGVVFITPVGLNKFTNQQLKKNFSLEVAKALITSVWEIFIRKKDKYTLELTKAVIHYAQEEIKKESLKVYLKKLDIHTKNLSSVYPEIIEKLRKIKAPVIFFLAKNDLVSPIVQIKNMISSLGMKEVKIMEKEKSNHGLPYTHAKILARDIRNFF